MMLRSSSTPVLGSLLSSFSESPQHPNHNHSIKISSNYDVGFHSISKSVTNSPSVSEKCGFRRVQSEGNLLDSGHKNAHKPSLEAIQSFSSREDYDSDDESEGSSDRFVTRNSVSSQEGTRSVNVGFFQGGGKMYLAAGTGVSEIDGGGCGGGGSCRPVDFGRDGGDSGGLSMEEHYKKMLELSPGNSLFLRNYAHFLYQEKGDFEGAEEYYSRAILADPEDGEVLCQYAKLIWELHHDKQRAGAYFERAVQASSQDSHIHASYASFLWVTEEDDDEDEEENSRLLDREIKGVRKALSVV